MAGFYNLNDNRLTNQLYIKMVSELKKLLAHSS